MSSLPSASDPSRCFHPFHTLSFIGLHLLYCSPRTHTLPSRQHALSNSHGEVMNVLDLHPASGITASKPGWETSCCPICSFETINGNNIEGLQYFQEITQAHTYTNTKARTDTHTQTHTCFSPANCWLLVCKSGITCLIKYRISNELR